MDIKLQLLTNSIIDIIRQSLPDIAIDADKIADTTAISALSEIQEILRNDKLSDFEIVDNIVNVFEKYHLDFGSQHDF